MYSGSVSARQSTNHNHRYRMLMDTCKFLSNPMKHIPRSSNHTYVHTNTRTSTWLHESPQDTTHGLYPAPLSLWFLHFLFEGKCRCSSTAWAHVAPCNPRACDRKESLWGCTCVPGVPCQLFFEGTPVCLELPSCIQSPLPRRVL